MSIRRTFQIAVVTLALSGVAAPMFTASEAQVAGDADRRPMGTNTTADDRGGPDFGWIGIIGLAGLAGLMGNRRETRSMSRPATSTATPR
jgi:hypothetical protein